MSTRIKWAHGSNITPSSLDTGTVIFDSSTKTIKLKADNDIEIYGDGIKETINLTWAELKALRDGGTLVPGQYYRITDYVTTTNGKSKTCSSPNTDTPVEGQSRSVGHQFDIIVRADSASTLNENAHAAIHEGDTYFVRKYGTYAGKTVPVSSWKLKYCLDNDTTCYEWADETNGKGVIYQMIDENNNKLGYDFKNIQFYRADVPNTYSEIYNLGELQQYFTSNPTVMVGAKFQFNTGWYYTFGYIRSDITTSITVDDLEDSTVVFGDGVSNNTFDNSFNESLPDIIEWSRNFFDNTFTAFCYGITFFTTSYCSNNSFGNVNNSQFGIVEQNVFNNVYKSLIYSKQHLTDRSASDKTVSSRMGIEYTHINYSDMCTIRCSMVWCNINMMANTTIETTVNSAYVGSFEQKGAMNSCTFSLSGNTTCTTILGFFYKNTITGRLLNTTFAGNVANCTFKNMQTCNITGLISYCNFPILNNSTITNCAYANLISTDTTQTTIKNVQIYSLVGTSSNYIDLSTFPNIYNSTTVKTFTQDENGWFVGSYLNGGSIKGYYIESKTDTTWKELPSADDWKRKIVETTESTVTLAANTITKLTGTSLASISVSIPTEALTDGQEYILEYSKESLSESCTISFDSSVKWANGVYIPSYSVMKDGASIQICIVNGCATWAQYCAIS